MGARPSSFKRGGGGFLADQDGTIVSYVFTDEFNGVPFKPGRWPDGRAKERQLFALLSARTDGAAEDVTTHLKVGRADDFEISEDGKTLTPVVDGNAINANSQWAIFIQSLCEAGFDEAKLPEDEINYEAIEGLRVRFVQRPNAQLTGRFGQRKGKDGREYDRRNLVVGALYGKATGTQPTRKASTKANGKATNGRAEESDPALVALAEETLIEILKQAHPKPVEKSRLSLKILDTLKQHDQRMAVYDFLFDDENLGRQNGWTYDAKKQKLALQ